MLTHAGLWQSATLNTNRQGLSNFCEDLYFLQGCYALSRACGSVCYYYSAKEFCRDLRALLKLLTHLTQRDLIDFGSTEEESAAAAANGAGQPVDVAQLVFLGLDILIPLISFELLGYPKLCLLYFQLLAYMMEVRTTVPHLQGLLAIVVLISKMPEYCEVATFQHCCCII